MVVQAEFQSPHHLSESPGGLDVVGTGRGIAGGVVVRHHQAAGVEVESPANRPPQGQFACGLARADVEVLRDEQAFMGEEQHHHAFLAAAEQPFGEILAESRTARLHRFAQQGFPPGNGCKVSRRDDHCRDGAAVDARFVDFVRQRLGRSGVDRAQRAEAPNQTAGNDLAPRADDGAEYLRQDG